MPKTKEVLSGTWMTYWGLPGDVREIPTRFGIVRKPPPPTDRKTVTGLPRSPDDTGATSKHVEDVFVLFEPTLDQTDAVVGLKNIRRYLEKNNFAGKNGAVIWSRTGGTRFKNWTVYLEEEPNPYGCICDTERILPNLVETLIIVALPLGWNKSEVLPELAAVRTKIETAGLCLSIHCARQAYIYLMSRDGSIEAYSDDR